MTRRNKAHKLLASAFAVLTALAVAGIDLEILAQNTNSSTTGDTTSAQNTNTGTTRRAGRRGTRTRRTRSGNVNAGTADDATTADTNTNASDDAAMQSTDAAGQEATTGTTQARRRRGGRRGRRAATATDASMTDAPAGQATDTGTDMAGGMQTDNTSGSAGTEQDLSGTYTGTINAPDWGLSGPATLTITGNTFTLDAGGNTQSGTLSARSWPGQVAVSMRFGTETPANIVSLRARHRGQSLTLTSVPGEAKQFSFRSGGGTGGTRRGRRGRRPTGTTNTTDTTTDDTTPPPVR